MSDPTELLELEVKTFDQLIPSIFVMSNTSHGKLWWRGQEQDWDLLPGVYRVGKKYSEEFLTFNFIRRAQSRHVNCPIRDNYPSWLFLMQHYGLPTRLLDWSVSPLIALFFALDNFDFLKGSDAVLWGLDAA